MSAERRCRLPLKWNNFILSSFMQKVVKFRYDALRTLGSTGPYFQLHLGESYQNDQYLRDVILNACKEERWAHMLAGMPNSCLLDVEKSLARAITAEETIFQVVTKNLLNPNTPEFANDVIFSSGPGLPYRSYEIHISNVRCNERGNEKHKYLTKKTLPRTNGKPYP